MSMSVEALEARRAYKREWYKKNIDHAREQSRIRQARFYERKAAAARFEQEKPEATENAEVEQQPVSE